MSQRRYDGTQLIAFGTMFGTSETISVIRNGIASGEIRYEEYSLQERERLDTLAGKSYGDGRLWWILAAASNIGWGLQVPPGTKVLIPKLTDVQRLLG
jgi:hypothetical protein